MSSGLLIYKYYDLLFANGLVVPLILLSFVYSHITVFTRPYIKSGKNILKAEINR